MSRSVVVTGAGGFIGRRLVAMLRADGVAVEGWTRAEVDLHDRAAVARALDRTQPHTIFHMASGAVSPLRQVESCIETEVAMVSAIIDAAAPGTIIVKAGSMAEYGRAGRLRETDAAHPVSVYGRAKLAATRLALERGPARGLAVTVARIFGAYGPGEMAGRLIPNLIDKLGRGEPVLLSDSLQQRDFIHVDDVCRALIALASAPSPAGGRVVNIGTGRAIPVRLACERIADAVGADRALLYFGAIARRATDEEMLEADVTALVKILGHAPPQRLLDSDAAALRGLIGA